MDAVVVPNSEFVGTANTNFLYPVMQAATITNTKTDIARLVEQHDRKIRWLARGFCRRSLVDDLIQEGRLAMLHAAELFDPTKGVAFWTYARKAVVREMIRFLTKECNEASAPNSLDHYRDSSEDITKANWSFDERFGTEISTPEAALEQAECMALTSKEFAFLSDMERKILQLRLCSDRDVRSIAAEIGVSKTTVDRVYQDALGKLRDRVGSQV